MTQEQKAKAYDMALEAARKELGVDRKEYEVVEQVLKSIFPELRESESESERINKAIFKALSFLSTLEESEKPMNHNIELNDEIYKEKAKIASLIGGVTGVQDKALVDFARHFAKWGAEHLADNKAVAFKLGDEIAINGYKLIYDKKENAIRVAKVEPSGSSEDLEEVAKKYAHCPFTDDDGNFHEDAIDETAYHNFIAGAEWQKEQMMQEAVEVEGVAVWQYLDKHGRDFYKVETEDFTTHGVICEGDKVRVIVCKNED